MPVEFEHQPNELRHTADAGPLHNGGPVVLDRSVIDGTVIDSDEMN